MNAYQTISLITALLTFPVITVVILMNAPKDKEYELSVYVLAVALLTGLAVMFMNGVLMLARLSLYNHI